MHSPNTPTAMQAPMTHEEKWAEAEEYFAEGRYALRSYYWKAAGRPRGPEEEWLPKHLWKNPPLEWWEEAA